MTSNRREWTAAEDTQLAEMISAGVSLARASVVLKRTMGAVRTRGRELGVPFPTKWQARQTREAKYAAALERLCPPSGRSVWKS